MTGEGAAEEGEGETSFLVAVAQSGIDSHLAFWSIPSLLNFSKDLEELEPTQIYKASAGIGRLTCVAAQRVSIKKKKSESADGIEGSGRKEKNRAEKRDKRKQLKFE